MEQTPEEARIYLQSIVDTVREAIVVLDARLRVVSANHSFYQTFQVSPEETEGRLIYELGNHQWDIPELRRLLEEIVPRNNVFNDFEVMHDFPGLGCKTMRLNARKLVRPGNHTEMLLLAIEDVTERKQAEAALKESEEQLRLMVEGARDHAMLMLDTNGCILRWNTGAERIMGWREDEVIGQQSALIFTPEDRAAGVPEQEMSRSRAEGRAEDVRWHLKKDGSLFFADGVMTSLRDEIGNVRGFAKVLRDATERKRGQDALQAAFEREQRIADTLQRPLTLEVAEDAFPGLAVATLYEAALDEAQIGGDFVDAFAMPRGLVALAIADASGKGLSAAARTMQVKDVLRAFAREYPYSPASIVARLNDYVCDTRYFDEQGGESFVCMALAILDPERGEGTVLSAGCEPPLVLRTNGEAEVIETTGMPLGIQPKMLYTPSPLRLGRGDVLVMATDGVTEARRDREFLEYEGMTTLAKQGFTAASVRDMGRVILDGARAFAGGSLRDDACLLLARRR